MTPNGGTMHLDVASLREAFDQSFAQPPVPNVTLEDFLSVPIGSQAWAIRITDVAGLFAGRTVTALPSAAASVVGLAAVAGGIRPVYDLAPLLGAPAAHAPRWLITAAAAPVAFAFEHFGGHVRMPAAMLSPAGAAGTGGLRHVGGWLRTSRTPILDLQSVIAEVRRIATGSS